MGLATIRSDGDLEVVVLHESQSFLADVVTADLYSVLGTAPDQSVMFHTESCFNLFLILVGDIFAEGTRSAFIDGRHQNYSLLSGLERLCELHPTEADATGLGRAVSDVLSWASTEVKFEFWCGDLDTRIQFPLRNDQLVSFGANTAKHNLLRLSGLLDKLVRLCTGAGHALGDQDLPSVLAAMVDEARSRLLYHSSSIVELLGGLFLSLNDLIVRRFAANPTNRVAEMAVPSGVVSDVFRSLYGSVLVFMRSEQARIRSNVPVTTATLKQRYQ